MKRNSWAADDDQEEELLIYALGPELLQKCWIRIINIEQIELRVLLKVWVTAALGVQNLM